MSRLTTYTAQRIFFGVAEDRGQVASVTTVFAVRMLLEDAARFTWLTQDLHDEDAFVQRSTHYFDEFRAKKNAIAT